MKHFFAPRPLDTPELSIRGIGIREVMKPGLVDRPRGTGDYLLMIFHDPALASHQSSQPGTLQPSDTMMIWTPGKGHFYGNAHTGFVHTWIHCQGHRVKKIISRSGLPLARPFVASNALRFQQALLDIHNELVSFSPPDPVVVGNRLENGLREATRVFDGKTGKQQVPEKLLEMMRLIRTAPEKRLTLAAMARMAGMSVPYFCASFKKYFGLPPVECLIRHRMQHAAHLLSDRNLNITGIAQQTGYEDLFHFSKTFKKHFGLSPRAFRQAGH